MAGLFGPQGLDPFQFARAEPVADQQHVATGHAAIFEQLEGEADGTIGTRALRRHHFTLEHRQ